MSPVVRQTVAARPAGAAARARPSSPKAGAGGKRADVFGKGGRVPGSRKIVNELLPGFSRQLAAMLAAGMPIVTSLDALEEQADNPNFKRLLGMIKRNIEGGSAFSEALRLFPAVFDNLYSSMVRGGESGGQLAETIARLASFLESTARLRRKVKSAMMYPVIVLCIALAIATGMIVFIVPVFGQMFADFGAQLPAPTQALLDVSNFVRKNGVYIIIVLTIAIVAFKKWKNSPQGLIAWDRFLLRLPVFGELNRKVAAARFARTFGQLTRSGVPILSALEISAGATGNRVTGQVILDARAAVEKGDPLSSAMVNQTVYPKMLVRMLQAGEKTGRIDDMMTNIADFYDEEVDAMLTGLTSLLEPLLMVFLGVIIGGIVLCMFLPIFKMGDIVSKG